MDLKAKKWGRFTAYVDPFCSRRLRLPFIDMLILLIDGLRGQDKSRQVKLGRLIHNRAISFSTLVRLRVPRSERTNPAPDFRTDRQIDIRERDNFEDFAVPYGAFSNFS